MVECMVGRLVHNQLGHPLEIKYLLTYLLTNVVKCSVLFFSRYIDRKKIFRQSEPEFGVANSNSYSRRNIRNILLTDFLFD